MLRILKQYYPIRNIFFVVGEGLIIYVSIMLACWLCLSSDTIIFDDWLYSKIFFLTIVCQACLYYNDLYDLKITNNFSELGIRLFQSLGAAIILIAITYSIIPRTMIGGTTFFMSVIFIILFIVSWRFVYAIVLDRGFFNQNIIIIGSSQLADNIIIEINDRKDCGYTVAVIIEEHNDQNADMVDNKILPREKSFNNLYETAKEIHAKKIIVALKEKRGVFPTKELLKCRVNGVDILEGNSFYEMLTGKLFVEQTNPDGLSGWFIFSEGFQQSRTKRFFKRIEDIVLSSVLLFLFLPVIVITAILIKRGSKGDIFFSQERIGENNAKYMVYKFRSMAKNAEQKSGPVWAAQNDSRVTFIGKFIRKWRVDEIPQLWNVLRGDMSFVGPRPERDFFVKKLKEIIPYYQERFSIKPGLTGWAQVSYGYGASVEDAIEKLSYDLFYIKNMSIFMDLIVILRTTKTVIAGSGAR